MLRVHKEGGASLANPLRGQNAWTSRGGSAEGGFKKKGGVPRRPSG